MSKMWEGIYLGSCKVLLLLKTSQIPIEIIEKSWEETCVDEEKRGLGLDLGHAFRLTTLGRKSILNMS
jgi:hypothetical protein